MTEQKNKGFVLLELLLSIFLLSVLITPISSLLINSFKTYSHVKEQTELLYLAQGAIESLWEKDYPLTPKIDDFIEYPGFSDYEYQLSVTPFSGNTLYEIKIILRKKSQPNKKIFLRTLEARGSKYGS